MKSDLSAVRTCTLKYIGDSMLDSSMNLSTINMKENAVCCHSLIVNKHFHRCASFPHHLGNSFELLRWHRTELTARGCVKRGKFDATTGVILCRKISKVLKMRFIIIDALHERHVVTHWKVCVFSKLIQNRNHLGPRLSSGNVLLARFLIHVK